MATYYAKRALGILREEGFGELVESSYQKLVSRQSRVRVKGYKHRLKGHPGVGNPVKLLNVPPHLITHYISTNWLDQPFAKEVTIRGGDWDLKAKPFEENPKPRYIKKYHEQGDITDRTQILPEWGVSEQHLVEFEELYESIKSDGFKTQEDLINGGDVVDEINICIGRDGKMIAKHGQHRVSIAKVLGLDAVPVYVRVRHEDWQRLRDEAWKAESAEQLSEETRRHVSHPDIRSALRR